VSAPAPAFDGPRAFCRDCLGDLDIKTRRCGECGSPRLVRHHALPSLTLAHIDCDAFYATVEKRDNPELADRPVIIGGGMWIDVAVAFRSTMAITTKNKNAASVEAGGVGRGVGAQNGGSSVSSGRSDWIMLCSESSS